MLENVKIKLFVRLQKINWCRNSARKFCQSNLYYWLTRKDGHRFLTMQGYWCALDWLANSIPREYGVKCVGDGWSFLVHACYDLCESQWPPAKVHQVKEKFAGLRFYTGGTSEEVAYKIEALSLQSDFICERCGLPGIIRPGGWIKTLCDKCNEERK